MQARHALAVILITSVILGRLEKDLQAGKESLHPVSMSEVHPSHCRAVGRTETVGAGASLRG